MMIRCPHAHFSFTLQWYEIKTEHPLINFVFTEKKIELIVVVLVFKSITIEQGPHFHNFWRRLQIFLLHCVPKQLLYL